MKIRRVIAAALTVACAAWLCASCAKNDEIATEQQIKEVYQNITEISAKASVRTNADDGREFCFVLQYSKNADDETVTVAEPEAISGIVINFKDGQAQISEHDTGISDGLGLSFKYTAANILPEIFKTPARDVVSDICAEKLYGVKYTAVSYTESGAEIEYLKRIWLDCASFAPKKAEIYADGNLVMECEFLTVEIK